MRNIPSEDTKTGKIYHHCLARKFQPVADIHEKLSELGVEMNINNVNAVLGMMFKDDLIDRKINNTGHYIYAYLPKNKLNGKAKTNGKSHPAMDKNESKQLALMETPKPPATVGGRQNIKQAMIEWCTTNIGRQFTGKQIAEECGLKYNSGINTNLNKLIDQELLTTTNNPYGNQIMYVVQEKINDYSKINGKKSKPHSEFIHKHTSQPQQKLTSTENLFGAFQQITEELQERADYRQALIQIAAILESVGIIEGAD